MLPYGILPGEVIGSARYGNKVMNEDDLRDFSERARMKWPPEEPPDSRSHARSRTRVINLGTQSENQVQQTSGGSSISRTSPGLQVEDPQDLLPPVNIEPRANLKNPGHTVSNHSAPTNPSTRSHSYQRQPSSRLASRRTRPAQQFTSNVTIRGRSSANYSEPPHTGSQVVENTFCDKCQLFIAESQTVRMQAARAREEGLTLYIENAEGYEEGEVVLETFPHYATVGALKASALDGCHLCSLLAAPDPADPDIPTIDDSKQYWLMVVCKQSYDGPGRIEMEIPGRGLRTTYIAYDMPLARIQGSLRHKRTDADEVFKLARRWLDTCLNHHKICRQSSNEVEFVPTRLLKVTASNSFLLSVQLCLTDSEDFQPHTPYLALSHCWGGADVLKLKTSNLDTFLRGLPLLSLPQNFTDAALATARLGYTYLWIDSLCIIQDSPNDSDWRREAATMGSVYSNAACSIAALGAANSNVGCFLTRNPLSFMPCMLRDGTGRDTVWAGNKRIQRPDSKGELRPPLHRRAWVVQERALATRTLYFGSEMVFWECKEAEASEESPEMKKTISERSDHQYMAQNSGLKTVLHTMKEVCRASGKWADWERFWWKMVREYTSSQLTFDRDKWTAFSGLAGAVEELTRTKLYHGLWASNLFDELLWKVLRPGKRVTDHDAPSWSWLSVNAGAGVQEQRYNFDMDFRRVATVAAPDDAEMLGDRPQRSKKLSVRGRRLRIASRVAYSGSAKKDYNFRLQDGRSIPERYVDGRWSPDVEPENGWELSILQFVATEYMESYGLVIRPADGDGGDWVRVGFYGMSWRNENGDGRGSTERYFGEIETVTLV